MGGGRAPPKSDGREGCCGLCGRSRAVAAPGNRGNYGFATPSTRGELRWAVLTESLDQMFLERPRCRAQLAAQEQHEAPLEIDAGDRAGDEVGVAAGEREAREQKRRAL